MKNLFFFAVLLAFLTTSCSPEKTEMWINKDGSGKIEVSIDLGEMAGMMTEALDSMGEEGEEGGEDTGGGEDSGLDMFGGDGEDIDSLMNFYEMMPDSVKEQMVNPEVLKKVNMHMKIVSAEEYAKIKISMVYDSAKELEEIIKGMNEANPEGGGMGDQEDKLSEMFGKFDTDLKNGIVRIEGIDTEDEDDPFMQEMMEELNNPEKAEDPEFIEMMKMLLGGETKTIVHVPGKILFTNYPDAEIKGNTVIFKDDILDMMKNGKDGEKIIKFKP